MAARWALLAVLATVLLAGSPLSASAASPGQGSAAVEVIGNGSGPASSFRCPPSQTVICDPLAVAFDSSGDLWVADGQDNRVLEFPAVGGAIATTASVVLGQPNFTSSVCGAGPWPAGMRSSTLCFPTGLAFDAKGDLWVSDGGGDRVVEFPLVDGVISRTIGEVIGPNFTSSAPNFPQDGLLLPVGLAFDRAGDLWVADLSHSRVLEFPLVDGSVSVEPSRVIGQSSMSGGFCNQTLTAAEQINATATDLCFPSGLAFDATGDLWVADFGLNEFVPGNSRVMEFPVTAGGAVSSQAAEVIGQPSFTGYGCNGGYNLSTNASLCLPVSIAFDRYGDLWVADSGNSRVLEFPRSGGTVSATAGTVIGQSDFNSHTCNQGGSNATSSSLCRPLALAFDQRGDLWVSDTDNNRIVEFSTSAIASVALPPAFWLISAGVALALAVCVVSDLALNRRHVGEMPA